ncbi:hypothetical protein MVEN_01602500 [Mycena venus]|uniref:Uncharacterized protein n=1 Tax=Mycena venus TaxID=2733690 RepID=A0A8H6XPX7_9AGAR|nr:hypothetical protein MVEN_01602500 [Mycena venus]
MNSNNPPRQVHGSHYYPLSKILVAWLVALGLASGHHGFYASLNSHVVESDDSTSPSLLLHSQSGASAVGTSFAFLVSAALSVSAGTAFLQCAWKLVRQRAFTVSGLDALWSSPHNVLAFFSFDFWRSARGIVLISALAWAFPLVVTFAPGTLTVQSRSAAVPGACKVPMFDFASSALLHDEQTSASKPYFRPSSVALEVVGSTLLAGQPARPTSPCGSNCSYILSANAPSFLCSPGLHNSSSLNWTVLNPRFTPPPYYAANIDVTPSVNELEFVDWDFEAQFTDFASWKPDPSGGTNLTCVAYNSTYHLNYTFIGSTASVAIKDITLHQPASQLTNATADSDGRFLPNSTTHTAWYNATANYYGVFYSMYPYLVGNITVFQSSNTVNFDYTPESGLSLTETTLFNAAASSLGSGNLTWSSNLPRAMESLMENITLSILTGSLDATQKTSTTCIFNDNLPHFAYNARRLWLVYGLGLGAALLCDIVGIVALFQNSFGATGGFSDFLAATRNSELNGLDLKQPQRIKLKYGSVRSEGGRYAFARPESLYDGNPEKAAPFSDRQKDSGTPDTDEPFLPERLYGHGR